MKRVLVVVLLLVFVFSLTACGDNKTAKEESVAETNAEKPTEEPTEDNRIAIPDIEDTDEATAKNLLSSNGLIPKIEYEYNDNVEKGNVIRTSPYIGSKVDKNSKVTVYISNGSSYIQAKSSGVHWFDVCEAKDSNWSIGTPYIMEETLYIDCEVTIAHNVEWIDSSGIGYASITDNFDKAVPISADFENQSLGVNETQHMTFRIPLGDLNVSQPTDMYLKLFAYIDGGESQTQINVNFYLTW